MTPNGRTTPASNPRPATVPTVPPDAADPAAAHTGRDRLARLLPVHLRRRDAEQGGALAALLAVMSEQLDVVEGDLDELSQAWFVETCPDWALPYLGDLIGYPWPGGYEEAVSGGGPAARALAARLAPRGEVADTVRDRRRKGTLPVLEEVAARATGWRTAAVETRRCVAAAPPVRLFAGGPEVLRQESGLLPRTADLRHGGELDLIGGPFDRIAHRAEVRRLGAAGDRSRGRYPLPGVGLFIWRTVAQAITRAPAHCLDQARNLYTFSVLGNDVPLVTRPAPEPGAGHLTAPDNVPGVITRRAAADGLLDFYGPGRSFSIGLDGAAEPIPPSAIVIADLSGWRYRPRRHQVAVDPQLGRIAFGTRHTPRRGVWVTYHEAVAAPLGAGGEDRDPVDRPGATVYRVGRGAPFTSVMDAVRRWRSEVTAGVTDAVIEIVDSASYDEDFDLPVGPGERLELRAAEGTRPLLRILDWHADRPEALVVRGLPPGPPPGPDPHPYRGDDEGAEAVRDLSPGHHADDDDHRHGGHDDDHRHGGHDDDHRHGGHDGAVTGGEVMLDGLLIAGRPVQVVGPVARFGLRRCTLVPGWSLDSNCAPRHPEKASLVLEATTACVQIERSVLGTVLVIADEVRTDPLPLHVLDSVIDATGRNREALSGPDCGHAHVELRILRSTVIGSVHAHGILLGQDCLFDGEVRVARRGAGCLRFSYVPPGSRTPRRFACQPDRALAELRDRVDDGGLPAAQHPSERSRTLARVRADFVSRRYGTSGYVRLIDDGPPELLRGGTGGGQLGVFHDLFEPQRLDAAVARLAEYAPLGSDPGVVLVT